MSLTRRSKRLVDRALYVLLTMGVPGWLFVYWHCSRIEGLESLESAAVAVGLVMVNGMIMIPASFHLASRCCNSGRRAVLEEAEAWYLIRLGLLVIAPIYTVWLLECWNDPIPFGTFSGMMLPVAFATSGVWVWVAICFVIAKVRVSRRLTFRLEGQVASWNKN